MQALIGFVLSVVVTLALGSMVLAMLAARRRFVAPMAEGESAAGPQRTGAGEIIDRDTRSAMAEVMAVYGSFGPAAREPEPTEIDESPIVRLANTILQQAIKEGASEIHLEAEVHSMRVRLRIDGVLDEIWQMPNYIKQPLTGRYKVLANVNLLEHRLSQTGQIGTRFQGKTYDLNVCFMPTRYGVTTTIRIYDQSSVRIGLNKPGLTPEMQAELEELVVRPTGLLLLAGPSGSGRGTLAYALLNKLNTIDRSLLTIEERPGFQLPGITQVYLDRKAGRTLPAMMTAVRQQSPDVILIGVDSSAETMRIALETAQNHLVIAIINAADAASALLRLTAMGIDPALTASALSGILAQRLVCRICDSCKEWYAAPASELHRFGYQPEDQGQPVQLAHGKGCESCRNSGYKGRIGLFELRRNTPPLADLIARGAPTAELQQALQSERKQLFKPTG